MSGLSPEITDANDYAGHMARAARAEFPIDTPIPLPPVILSSLSLISTADHPPFFLFGILKLRVCAPLSLNAKRTRPIGPPWADLSLPIWDADLHQSLPAKCYTIFLRCVNG